MPDNVRQGFGNSPLDIYWSFPPVTRTLVTCFLAGAVLTALGFVSPYTVVLVWPAVLSKKMQVWRLVTTFIYAGGFSPYWLSMCIWAIQYGKAVEQAVFRNDSADYLFMLLFGGFFMLLFSWLIKPFVQLYLLSDSLVFMIVYIWSRNNPSTQVSFFGIASVEGRYLPWVLLVISMCMKGNWQGDLLGLLVGHLYYFLTVIHPQATGRQYVQTPAWLRRLMISYNIGNVPHATVQMHNPADPRFRVFRGQGRRLAD